MEKELLLKVLDLSYEISSKTKADVFFQYYPHVDTFGLYYYKEGEKEAENAIYISYSSTINKENLEDAIEKLEKLKTEVKEND